MRWEDLRRSSNIGSGGGGGLGGLAIGGGGLGVVVIAVIAMFFGVDPRDAVRVAGAVQGQGGGAPAEVTQGCQPGDQVCDFTSAILGSTEDVWTQQFAAQGVQYQPPQLTYFTGSTQTACGAGQAAMGPFYCPADRRVYIDYSFYQELEQRFGAPGDFAQAYVVAHEVGHHVQNLTGASAEVQQVRARGDERAANQASVRLELQADCYAGVWANAANQQNIRERGRPLLEPGEEREPLAAASAIGDDTLQRQSQGRVVPDSFTHGSSDQRVRWFRRGFESGDMNACDTFRVSAGQL